MSPHATPENTGKDAHFREGAAPGAALIAENAPIDADLTRVIAVWPSLPAAIRAGVLAMIEAADTTAAE